MSYIDGAVVQVRSKAGHVFLQKPPLGKLVSVTIIARQSRKLNKEVAKIVPVHTDSVASKWTLPFHCDWLNHLGQETVDVNHLGVF